MPYLNSDGTATGETLFVATDDSTLLPLPFFLQQDVCLQESVAKDPSVFADYEEAHWGTNLSKGITGRAQALCRKKTWRILVGR